MCPIVSPADSSSAEAARDGVPDLSLRSYLVRADDSLSEIAHRFGIDLDTLTAEEVVNYPANDLLILCTAAIDVGDEIWVGQVAEGDRIARFPAP